MLRLSPLPRQWLVMVCPLANIEEKTRRMYNLLGRESYTRGQVTRALVDAMEQGRFSWQMLYNAFESVAFDVFPGLDGVMRDMEAVGARHISLSGSGPALYTLVADKEQGRRIRDGLVRLGRRAFLVETTNASPHLTLGTEDN